MPPPRNVIVVETPLQILNAVEYRERVRLEDPVLLILLTAPATRATYEGTLSSFAWSRVIFLPICSHHDLALAGTPIAERGFLHEQYMNLRRIALRRRLDRFARRMAPVDTLVIGNYLRGHKDYIRHLANIIPHRALVLVDDGTDTLRVGEERAAGRLPPGATNGTASGGCKQRVRARCMDLRTGDAPALTYFSAFEVGLSGSDVLVKNDFRGLRERARSAERSDEVYFVGQPLASDGYLSLESYYGIVRAALARFAPAPFIYVAHPRESAGQLERLRALPLRIVHFTRPVEYELVVAPSRPRQLAGLFSTALHNCSLIFGSELRITCFEIPVSLLGKLREETAGIYAVLRRHAPTHFEVVPLDPGADSTEGTPPRV
jgi:hypothetical protein